MAYVLASGRSLTRVPLVRAGVLHTTFTCEQQQKRHYVEKPGKSKTTKGRARKSAKPLSAPDDTQSEEHKAFAEWVEHYGLGKTDGAAEWRDQKLDAKVAELFRQTLESGRKLGATLHSDDMAMRELAKDAQERIAHRIAELRQIDMDRAQSLLYLLYETPLTKLQSEAEEGIREGAIPGTINQPWGKNSIWKFFDSSVLDEHEESAEIPDVEQNSDYAYEMEPEGMTVGEDGELRKLEQLEDPLVWHDTKKNKKTCIFCSEDRHLYPLEPMNVPLLMKFMTPGGFIKKRTQTGLCKTMQARVSRTIKQARNLGLFSYKGQTFRVRNPMITHFEEEEEMDDETREYEEFEREREASEDVFNEKEYRAYLQSLEFKA